MLKPFSFAKETHVEKPQRGAVDKSTCEPLGTQKLPRNFGAPSFPGKISERKAERKNLRKKETKSGKEKQDEKSLGKKGSGWLLFFFVIFLTLMGGILMYEVYELRQSGSTAFGEKQVALFQLYGDSEEKVLELREYGRRARDESVGELSSNGGLSKDNSCGKWRGEVVWDYDKCWPDVERNFQLLVERKLEERGLRVESVAVESGRMRVGFGNLEFSREFDDGGVTYLRNMTIEEDVGMDFMQIQEMKRRLIEAKNKGDYSGLGKIEAGYIRLSIENDKNTLRLLQGKGFVVEKPAFVFWVKAL